MISKKYLTIIIPVLIILFFVLGVTTEAVGLILASAGLLFVSIIYKLVMIAIKNVRNNPHKEKSYQEQVIAGFSLDVPKTYAPNKEKSKTSVGRVIMWVAIIGAATPIIAIILFLAFCILTLMFGGG